MRTRGVALLVAMVIVAIITMMATKVGVFTHLDAARVQSLLSADQGTQIALGAEGLAQETLHQIVAHEPNQTHFAQGWAMPQSLPYSDGQIDVLIEDMQGRLNVNNVINPNGSPNEVMIDRLRRLFERVQVDPRLVDKLVDWIDSDQLTSGPDGAEDAVYLGLSPAMRPSNRPISSVSTLLFLPGMDSEKMARLKPYLAALPVGSKLNVCTAKAAVLASIATSLSVFAQDDKALATQRRSGCFPRLQDIQPYLTQAAGANPNSLNLLSADLAENSNYFQVQSTITQGGFALRALSELWVQTDGSSVVLRRSIGWD